MRGNQLTRQWRTIGMLEFRKRGLTINDLSDELDAHTRTVYRELQALQAAGFPLYSEKNGRKAYWKFVGGYKAGSSIPFTKTELTSHPMSNPHCGNQRRSRGIHE